MKRLPLISVIVPAFNAESTLDRCVLSILTQDISIEEYEIIIIDDGSNDKTLQIANSYSALNSNIIVFSHENSGLSATRNLGINNARGDFLFFVDSDDFLEPNSLGYLLKIISENNVDILFFDFAFKFDNSIVKHKRGLYNKVIKGTDFFNVKQSWVTACFSIFNKRLFLNTGFRFKEGIYYEDLELIPKLILNAERIYGVEKLVYYYVMTENSILRTNTLERSEKKVNDKLYAIQSVLHYLDSDAVQTQTKDKVIKNLLYANVVNLFEIGKDMFLSDVRSYFKLLKSLRSVNMYPLKDIDLNFEKRIRVNWPLYYLSLLFGKSFYNKFRYKVKLLK